MNGFIIANKILALVKVGVQADILIAELDSLKGQGYSDSQLQIKLDDMLDQAIEKAEASIDVATPKKST